MGYVSGHTYTSTNRTPICAGWDINVIRKVPKPESAICCATFESRVTVCVCRHAHRGLDNTALWLFAFGVWRSRVSLISFLYLPSHCRNLGTLEETLGAFVTCVPFQRENTVT